MLKLFLIGIAVLSTSVAANVNEYPSFEELTERLARASRVKRIIGGFDVKKSEWPWLCLMQGKIPTRWWWFIPIGYTTYYCGASIIAGNAVVTSAHCFFPPGAPSNILTPKYWHITCGEVDKAASIGDSLESIWGKITGQRDLVIWKVHASKIIIHPHYSTQATWRSDIAILKLEKSLPIGPEDPDISVLTLPVGVNSSWPEVGSSCYMKGWGCTKQDGSLSDTAKAVVLPILSSSVCDNLFGSISDTKLSAGYNFASTGICKGDSGGPLVCKDGDTWKLAGIASYSSSINSKDVPSVFTRVTSFTQWIQATLNNL